MRFRSIVATLVALLPVLGLGQFGSDRVTLLANMPPALFGASSGNDCWGYVSPSGREYAIMGLRNQVAFVEVTDPKHPVWFASVPHLASTWGDIKVFGHHAYAVTEAIGSGVQVIDMSQIDSHIVTLVKTIASPGRTHNLALDTESGYLYTCGSRNGTGTTMCFSLANPGDPVQVGADTMTDRYQHDAIVVPYTSGPYAGRQILFGFSEDRGVDIVDVTNKNDPFLIKRVIYPAMRYCHQGWLSADRKYLYVDDELDEAGTGEPTRTLVFDVSSLEHATYLNAFSTGLNASDHNQYFDGGFLFQANYKSGLRIFDTYRRETNPRMAGFFDTYPDSNSSGFEGAWSTFPFFPSGTVIVSDINQGLFILDVTEATTRPAYSGKVAIIQGAPRGGSEKELQLSDDARMVIGRSTAATRLAPPIELILQYELPSAKPIKLTLDLETRAPVTPMLRTVELLDSGTQQYVQIDSRIVTNQEEMTAIDPPGVTSRFISSTGNIMKVRVRFTVQNPRFDRDFQVEIDTAALRVVR